MRSSNKRQWNLSNVLKRLDSGTQLTVLTTESGWTKVIFEETVGWIISRHLKHVGQKTYVTDEFDIPMRSSNQIQSNPSNILKMIPSYTRLELLLTERLGWSKVRLDNQEGWIISRYLTSKKPTQIIPGNYANKELDGSHNWNTGSSDPFKASITAAEMLYVKGMKYFDKWKTKEKGFELIREAANYGFYEAQHKLGDIYSMNGDHGGLPVDYSEEEAFKWYKKSATQGYAPSQYEVGAMYQYGEGVYQSYDMAVFWYEKAAKKDNPDAQYELGRIYANGFSGELNYAKAMEWYTMAVKHGDIRAKNQIALLNGILTNAIAPSGEWKSNLSRTYSLSECKKYHPNLKDDNQRECISGSEYYNGDGKVRNNLFYPKGYFHFKSKLDTRIVDIKSPKIYLDGKDFSTISNSQILISGSVDDDSQISDLTIFGSRVPIGKSGKFNTALYVPLGKSSIIIEAFDEFGNKSSKVVTVIRNKPIVRNKDERLIPPINVRDSNLNAVALIIGVDKYKSITSAPWAESDAGSFYDYAQNVLGISTDRIRLITGSDSSEAGIWKSIERWLPTEVEKNKSDVYVYFAGHGLASVDGNNAYLLPWDGDPDLLERTAILRSELIDGLKDLDAKNVTLFMDTCYSGKARGGEDTLVADSRGLRIVKKDKLRNIPSNFTLFSAAGNDETASSHPSLKHGLFSYWMMRGLGGEADNNNDRKITNGELHKFINKNVKKAAVSMGRKQNSQLVGDKNKVIVSW